MYTANYRIVGVSPLSFSRSYKNSFPKLPKETDDAFEKRTWKDRCHYSSDGYVLIPPMAFKFMLTTSAVYSKLPVPGAKRETWKKYFEAGLIISDPVILDQKIKREDVEGEWFLVPSQGVRGVGKRVEKCFPVIREWSGPLSVVVLEDKITPDILTRHLEEAGKFVGVGRFRPEMGGFYGRFTVDVLDK